MIQRRFPRLPDPTADHGQLTTLYSPDADAGCGVEAG